MVGVPGRSKACHTCRQRRIKCGAEVPTCRNCAKSRRICAGYQRKHAFILSQNMVSSDRDTFTAMSQIDKTESESGKVMVARWRLDQTQPVTITTSAPKTLFPDEPTLDSFPLPTEVNPRNAFRDKLFSVFADSHLPATNYAGLGLGDRNRWMLQVVNLPKLSPALEDALLAVYTARLGRHVAQPAFIHESLRLYTSSIIHMRKGMQEERRVTDQQYLAACSALLLYEVLECPGGTLDGYRAHWQGALQLLQLRGADAHAKGLARSILEILRLPSVLFGLLQNKKSFLAQPEWRDFPWASNSEKKGQFDRLVDIYLDMPELTAQRCALEDMSSPRQILDDALATLRDGERIAEALDTWFNCFRTTVPESLYHAELSTMKRAVDDTDLGKLFPVAFHFPAFIVAQNLIFYWAALVHVRSHLCGMHATLSRIFAMLDSMGRTNLPCSCAAAAAVVEGGQNPLECLRHVTVDLLPAISRGENWPFGAARNICQSVEYFFKDSVQRLGPATVMPPLLMVRHFWAHEAPGNWDVELAWLDDTLDLIRKSGTGITMAL